MKLYLVRHGEYGSSDMDSDPPLSEKGRKDTATVALRLIDKGIKVDEIRHSVKKRAKETAEIIAHAMGAEGKLFEKEGLKPNDQIEPVLVGILAEDRTVMLVGHLPFMEKLLTYLLFGEEQASPVNICNSCVICLEGEGSQWKIDWVVAPTY